MKSIVSRVPYSFAFAVAAIVLLHGCAPEVATAPPAPEPERFIEYSPEQIQEEILRLKRLLADTTAAEWSDTVNPLAREKVMTDLFLLTVHRKNADPDYGQALGYARYLFQNVPEKRLYYASWGRLLKEHMRLADERDSLQVLLDEASEKPDGLGRLQRHIRRQTEIIDSLTSVADEQAETIRRLQQLDVQMEQERSRIQ
ncbi:MAG: hypothetical protein GF418_07740 [Chitinivibrionales bacterium]|nr:hypothetical protein [Chitinivibrionales bacterium]MBD3395505.1 hypothetical protein [Chitinivibrionales bacterium]